MRGNFEWPGLQTFCLVGFPGQEGLSQHPGEGGGGERVSKAFSGPLTLAEECGFSACLWICLCGFDVFYI